MNFLEIAKETNIAAGLQGDVDSVVSPTGIRRTIIHFINNAYKDIQLFRDNWAWMRLVGTFDWTTATTSYSNSNVKKWFLIYYNGSPLKFVEHDDWLLKYESYQATKPEIFTINPADNSIIINPTDQTYTIKYTASCVPESLSENTQIPKLPVYYHNVIVYKAAYEIGLFLGSAEIMSLNATRYDFLLGSLLRDQNIPKAIKQRPLA